MMQAFRNSAKLIAAFFGVMLLLWLVDLSGITGGSGVFSKTTVGKINGQRVDTRSYDQQVQERTRQRQQQTPGQLSLEDIQSIRDEVWDQFIQNRIINQEMERHHIQVTSDEIVDAIRTSPPPVLTSDSNFQTDGRFDPEKYERWLTSSNGQAAIPYLEAQYRDELRQAKLWQVVTADVFLSDASLWEKYRDEHETVKIRLAAIVPRTVVPDSGVTITPQEVEQYYKDHQEDFRRTRTAYMSYVALPRAMNAADSAEALTHARALREEIASGTSTFEDVARRESSDSVSGSKGGDLGEWTRGDFDTHFDSAAFSMPLNTLSQPVLTQFGYHLIEVTSRQGNKAKGRHILVPIEVAGNHRDQLDAQADSLESLGAERLDPAALDTVGRVLNLPILHTGPVQEGTRVQVGRFVVPDAGVWAFQAQKGEIGSIIEIPEAFFIFRLDSTQAAGIPLLETIRPAVESAVRDIKKRTKAREIAKNVEQRMTEGSTLSQAADALKLPNQEMGPFSRVNPPLPNPQLIGAAFGLAKGEHSKALDTEEGIYFIEALDHVAADSADFAKQVDDLRAQAIRAERQSRIRSYMASLRTQAVIKDYRSEIYQTTAQAEAQAARIQTQNGTKTPKS
ncbi:MAG: SurA N-terminal domain-containing protein [Gemmatimonadota bacterium]